MTIFNSFTEKDKIQVQEERHILLLIKSFGNLKEKKSDNYKVRKMEIRTSTDKSLPQNERQQ